MDTGDMMWNVWSSICRKNIHSRERTRTEIPLKRELFVSDAFWFDRPSSKRVSLKSEKEEGRSGKL